MAAYMLATISHMKWYLCTSYLQFMYTCLSTKVQLVTCGDWVDTTP